LKVNARLYFSIFPLNTCKIKKISWRIQKHALFVKLSQKKLAIISKYNIIIIIIVLKIEVVKRRRFM